MWNSNLILLTLATFLRADYEIHKAPESLEQLGLSSVSEDVRLTSRQQEWAEKAVRHYLAAQERKWRNWNEAMFEKVE
jgi:hypothetical protein